MCDLARAYGSIFRAHSPQLGQGCNLALVDAEKLVDCLVAARPDAAAAANLAARHAAVEPAARTSAAPVSSTASPDARITSALSSYTSSRWCSHTATPLILGRPGEECFDPCSGVVFVFVQVEGAVLRGAEPPHHALFRL